MKMINANIAREKFTTQLMTFMREQGEDVGKVATNEFNFPIVIDDEEGWIEVLVRVPKTDFGFERREEFEWKEVERKEKEKMREEAKRKKIKRDEERRKKKEKEEVE